MLTEPNTSTCIKNINNTIYMHIEKDKNKLQHKQSKGKKIKSDKYQITQLL